MKKRIAIIGSTNTIGKLTLELIQTFPELFIAEILSADDNEQLLKEQTKTFQPNAIVIHNEESLPKLKNDLQNIPVKVFGGEEALGDVMSWESVDLVIVDLPGIKGVEIILKAIEAGKPVAIGSKETMVLGGEMIMQKAQAANIPIFPLEFETNGILQSTRGESWDTIEKITLTASGGPFLDKKPNFLLNVKKIHAIPEPNPLISDKIYVDSASLMNKGLDMIASKHLFALENKQLDIIIHPENIVHSIVTFYDGNIKSVIGPHNLKKSILYILGFPQRIILKEHQPFHLKSFESLSFMEPDIKTFRNLQLAQDAMVAGGNMPAILNFANNFAVDCFLNNKINFVEMSDLIEFVMNESQQESSVNMEILMETKKNALFQSEQFLKNLN